MHVQLELPQVAHNERVGAGRPDQFRADRVHSDPVDGALGGERPGQPDHPALGRGVRRPPPAGRSPVGPPGFDERLDVGVVGDGVRGAGGAGEAPLVAREGVGVAGSGSDQLG